jgi:signal transduction histidine kinase
MQRSAISPQPTDLDHIVRRAVEAVRVRPEFRSRTISLTASGATEGIFDPKKLERAFFNLVLNACEATPDPDSDGRVIIDIQNHKDTFEVRIIDQGSGIPASIRATAFDPFVSSGKPNGTGLGLAIVTKIVQDHGGSVILERSSESGTVMLVQLPRHPIPVASHTDSFA